MTKYIGETVKVKTVITNPELATPLVPTSVTITIWPPDATLPPVATEVAMVPKSGTPGTYEYFFDSSLVPPVAGSYVFRITALGSNYKNWEYGNILFQAPRRV